jgi:tRNA pseudouridine32 synthase/23S rRNA pseudouridine746 synthase
MMIMLTEIYRDQDLVIVSKPSGLLCVPGLSSPDNLFDQVKETYPNARVVHRLDMATSGLVIFALHYEAQKALGRLFEHKHIHKRYKALVDGLMADAAGEVCLPIVCDWEKRPKQKVCWQTGKQALTRFRVEKVYTDSNYTRVTLHPVTGRTHQLRVHMHALGHGILGDALYLGEASQEQHGRLMLHAEHLAFQQPLSGKPLSIEAPCPF